MTATQTEEIALTPTQIEGPYYKVGSPQRSTLIEPGIIVPACYEPRQARHIHVKVQGVSRPYTTQLYFSDDADRLKDNFYLKELEVQVDDLPDGRKRGQYSFVIRQVTEKDNVTPESLAARVA